MKSLHIAVLATLTSSACSAQGVIMGGASIAPPQIVIDVSKLTAVGQVDERFLSYNVEMAEVTGGNFWRPYGSPGTDRKAYRPPINLADQKLRKLAAALAPAYIRISGTWANATWFADAETVPSKAPAGFDTVLTWKQWRGAIAFAKASDGKIVTSFATSAGTRDANGVWQTDTAARWLAYTRKIGGTIAATEFANEPNMISLTQPPARYVPADYRRDYARFASWLRMSSPSTKLLAPGVAELGEPIRTMSRRNKSMPIFEGDDLLDATSPVPDGFSFHYYGSASERCGGKMTGHTIADVLKPQWLDSVDTAIARVAALRDRKAPGVPLWNTESAETACGGNPWASAFADSFRFVDTLGRSALQGVRVYMHNTLAASDYALLDEHNYTPRPNYWAAILWKRTMGSTVLAFSSPAAAGLRVYAHCSPTRKGGVGLAIVNNSDAAQLFSIGRPAQTWVLQAPSLESKDLTINGVRPAMQDNGIFTGLDGTLGAGGLSVPAKSVAFVKLLTARNAACR